MMQLSLSDLQVDIPHHSAFKLDMTIESGQFWGILGPNGVGKTTLLHTLAGLRKPKSGTITLDQLSLTDMARDQVAQRIGMMFQSHQDGFPASVRETVMLGRHPHLGLWQRESDSDHALVDRAIAKLELTDLQHRLVTELSGGERQRVAMAMLLAQDPDVWLVDEPTNHLDLHHQVAVMQRLHQQAKAGSIVVAALHDVNLAARWCTHVLLLSNDQPPKWGDATTHLTLDQLIPLYKQPLAMTMLNGRPIFVPVVD